MVMATARAMKVITTLAIALTTKGITLTTNVFAFPTKRLQLTKNFAGHSCLGKDRCGAWAAPGNGARARNTRSPSIQA
jgi:hypothetical protein